MAEPESEWRAWRHEVFGDPYSVWHDGADFATLLERWAADSQYVLRMLALGLADHDPLAARSVTFLARLGKQLAGVEGELRDCVDRATGTFLVRVAEALFVLTCDPALAEPVCKVLTDAAHWGERVDAAIALNAFPPTPAVIAALAGGVEDNDYLVRRHSAQAMLILAGQHTTVEKTPEIWNLIRSGTGNRSWRDASERLRRLVSQ